MATEGALSALHVDRTLPEPSTAAPNDTYTAPFSAMGWMSRFQYSRIVSPPETPLPDWKLSAFFWMLGLLNNASYVIMLACAKNISEGGTAVVFLANILPSMILKLSAPYWFDFVSYSFRLKLATLLMVIAFAMVASGHSLIFQLTGVGMASLQCGLGEASLLALAGKMDRLKGSNCLTAFSSGTGLAGVFGFLWKVAWNEWLSFRVPVVLWLAQSLAFLYYIAQHQVVDYLQDFNRDESRTDEEARALTNGAGEQHVHTEAHMTLRERFFFVLSLWPYMVPLFLVYWAEYALQSGIWTGIGFPVDDVASRNKFYEYSNWMYQAGVFVSRSSGSLFTAPMYLLWLMPVLQCINVLTYMYIGITHRPEFFYSMAGLLPGCFYVGLLGGAVYIHGYKRVCADIGEHQELALAATSVAESFGIVLADLLGLLLQGCLYQANKIDGALVSCPWKT